MSECCQLHCSTHSLYSGGQYVGGRCTLEVALVNAVGHVAVHVCCSLRLLHNLLAAAEGSPYALSPNAVSSNDIAQTEATDD